MSRKEEKNKVGNIVCIVCSILMCIVPFIPFVDQQDVIYDLNDLSSSVITVSHLVLYLRWYGYLPILLAVLIIVSTFLKNSNIKKILSYIMLAFDVCIVGGFIYWANKVVARIFEGDLYEPAAGYYILLVSGIVVLIATLMRIMNIDNNTNVLKDGSDNADRVK